MTGETKESPLPTGSRTWVRRTLREPLEAALVWVLLWVFQRMSLDRASAIGGAIGRTIGPRMGASNRARRNLRAAFPDWSEAQITATIRAMWDNLARGTTEIARLDALQISGEDARIEVVGGEHLQRLRDDGIGGFVFSGHLGSWDAVALVIAQAIPGLINVYRPLNNPIINRMMRRSRPNHGEFVRKGSEAARALIGGLREGRHFAMLVDQKMNDGIPVPFFGRDAMTASALARLAIREGVPMVPCRCERLDGARFRVTCYPPLQPASSGDEKRDTADTMAKVNDMLEDWIRQRPEEWLWVHNRWPD